MVLKTVIVFAVLMSFANTASAQAVSTARLENWEFRFYACKNVIMNAAIVAQLMKKHQLTGESGVKQVSDYLGTQIAVMVQEHENKYQFTDGEALFVSDLTFAVVGGMVVGGFELITSNFLSVGNDVCISTIEDLTQ